MLRFPSPTRSLALAALVALGATSAQAQSTVTLFGLIDVSAGKFQSPGAKSTKGIDSGNMTTSFWGVKGTEDLGGGMSAVFSLESFLRADVGASGRFGADTFWARNAFVGLASKDFGKVTLGAAPKFIVIMEPDVGGKAVMREIKDEPQPLEITEWIP